MPGADVARVRRFNRFYTRAIGTLDLVGSTFTLTEARVLYELGIRERPLAAEIARDLRLDAGYLSRILRGFERRGLLRRLPSPTDARRSPLELTRLGRQELARLNRVTDGQVGALLAPLDAASRMRLLECMRMIEEILG
jgi:DNA-binding MarR family transcriptional regulator